MDSHQSKELSHPEHPSEPERLHQIPHSHENNKKRLEYEQYRKIYLTSYLLHTEKERLHQRSQHLTQLINDIQSARLEAAKNTVTSQELAESEDAINRKSEKESDRPKRVRRKAEEIPRSWQCKEDFCGKKYGAHASLLQHVKLKHPTVCEKYF